MSSEPKPVKLYSAIQTLTISDNKEITDKVFRYGTTDETQFEISLGKYGTIKLIDKSQNIEINIPSDYWTENFPVQKVSGFLTAIGYFKKGYQIICKWNNILGPEPHKTIYTPSNMVAGNDSLIDQDGDAISAEEISNGIWYINTDKEKIIKRKNI